VLQNYVTPKVKC